MYVIVAWLALAALLVESSAFDSTGGNDDVDFLLGLKSGVGIYRHKDGIYYTLATTLEKPPSGWVYSNDWANSYDWVRHVDYHFSKNLVFASNRRSIIKIDLDPKATPSNGTVIKNGSWCGGVAVDWVCDRVYWTDCREGNSSETDRCSIKSCGLDGEGEETVVAGQRLGGAVTQMVIDPYKGKLFWLKAPDEMLEGYVLQSIDTSGGNFRPNMTDKNIEHVIDIHLDTQSRRVYYVADQALFSIGYNGGFKVKHFSSPTLKMGYGASGFGVVDKKVFWLTDAPYGQRRKIIYEAYIYPTFEKVKLHKYVDEDALHMRVVHPSLQKFTKDWCEGCEHACVKSSATGPSTGAPLAKHYILIFLLFYFVDSPLTT